MKSTVLCLVVLALAACGDDSSPSPSPVSDGSVPATDGQSGKLDWGDPNACKLEITKAVILQGIWSDGTAWVQVAGKATPEANLDIGFSYQGKVFSVNASTGQHDGGFIHLFKTGFASIPEVTVIIRVSKPTCKTVTMSIVAKPGPLTM